MRTEESIVRTKDGNEWSYSGVKCESVDEAIEKFGPDGTLYLINSSLTVKQQNVAREMFRQGKEREAVDEAVVAYRPGSGGRQSVKAVALKAIMDNRDMLLENPDLMANVQKAFCAGKFKDVAELLS